MELARLGDRMSTDLRFVHHTPCCKNGKVAGPVTQPQQQTDQGSVELYPGLELPF